MSCINADESAQNRLKLDPVCWVQETGWVNALSIGLERREAVEPVKSLTFSLYCSVNDYMTTFTYGVVSCSSWQPAENWEFRLGIVTFGVYGAKWKCMYMSRVRELDRTTPQQRDKSPHELLPFLKYNIRRNMFNSVSNYKYRENSFYFEFYVAVIPWQSSILNKTFTAWESNGITFNIIYR